MHGDRKRVVLSGLAIRKTYLQDIGAQGASLAGTYRSDTVFGEAFSYPASVALSAEGAHLVPGIRALALAFESCGMTVDVSMLTSPA